MRRSLDVLVDDGLLLAGDAACMVLPAHGSGVASALLAGDLAARTVARCLKQGEADRQSLWEYGMTYQRGRGALMAYFDFVRLLSQRLDEAEMEKLVGYAMTPLDLEIALAARPLPLRPGICCAVSRDCATLFPGAFRQPGPVFHDPEEGLRALSPSVTTPANWTPGGARWSGS